MTDHIELSFRTSVGGFHKGDVTAYIENTSRKHKAELSELESEIARLQNELEQLRTELSAAEDTVSALEAQLGRPDAAAVTTAAASEETTLSETEPTLPIAVETPDRLGSGITFLELAAYRRAEQAERTANNRAKALYMELDRINSESQTSISAAQSAAQELLRQFTDQLNRIQEPYNQLLDKLNDSKAKLEVLGAMSPDPSEGMEDIYE